MSVDPHSAVMGWVQLRGLRCAGQSGGPAGAAEQRFVVDVALQLDLAPVARSDDYADTVDIAHLAATVREVVSGPARLLLETLAVQIARLILDRYPRALQVQLRLAKPEPPGLDAAQEAVELTLDRGRQTAP